MSMGKISKPKRPPGPPTQADASVIDAGSNWRDDLMGYSVITSGVPWQNKPATTSKTTKTGG